MQPNQEHTVQFIHTQTQTQSSNKKKKEKKQWCEEVWTNLSEKIVENESCDVGVRPFSSIKTP